MKSRMPVQLGKSPLREVIFELRFEAKTSATADLLPGLLYPVMKNEYPEVAALPIASIPREIRDRDSLLLYQPSHRLKGGPHQIQFGDRSILLVTTAYPGWSRFKDMVQVVVNEVKRTDLLKRVERFSFKYTNLIESQANENQLSFLNLSIQLLGEKPLERGFHLRTERDDQEFLTITEIIPGTTVKSPAISPEISGLLITVDTIRLGVGDEFLIDVAPFLDQGHSVAKQTFYSLLTESTIDRLEPVY